MRGDALASGGKSATFGGPNVSQAKWDAAFGEEETELSVTEVQKAVKGLKKSGHVVEAIKLYRKYFKVGLREAADYVRSL